jgi:hypothetical protein
MSRMNKSRPSALSLKPDLAETARRWDAFYAGDTSGGDMKQDISQHSVLQRR